MQLFAAKYHPLQYGTYTQYILEFLYLQPIFSSREAHSPNAVHTDLTISCANIDFVHGKYVLGDNHTKSLFAFVLI